MAHFGIESIEKKDGYPSQNDFALSASMARFRHRRFNAKRMVRSENDFGLRTGRRPSFLSVGLAITGFINFTTIIYRVSAMDLEIEPMGPKIRLWPCGARRA